MKQRLISHSYIFHNNDAFYHGNDKSNLTKCGSSAKETFVIFSNISTMTVTYSTFYIRL